MKEILENIKNYFLYLNELGIPEIPGSESLKKFIRKENTFSTDSWDGLKEAVLNCNKCSLARIRKTPVFGSGNTSSKLMIITEYPDRDEEYFGIPFTGKSEEILKRMLLSIKLRKEDFFITHAVKCKTPGNRPPDPEEIQACKGFLFKQIKLLEPKLILGLGFTPPKVFFKNPITFSTIRGRTFRFKNIMILFTYHPKYIEKNPAVKRLVWEDLQKFKVLYEEIFNNS